jgi:hypothetical protein
MKKIKKGVCSLAYTLVIGMSLNTGSLFAKYDSNSKNQESLQHIDSSKKRIHIPKSSFLEEFIARMLLESVQRKTEYLFSDNFVQFCEKTNCPYRECSRKM